MEDLISIHAPREGCDHRRRLRLRPQAAISIHAPREGCDGICEFLGVAWRDISIHAPREGCDSERTILIFFCYLFQSTHPARGATIQSWLNGTMLLFQSTHPARGATRCAIIGCRALENFNPRTPRGVRRFRRRSCTSGCYFNPRTPRGVRPGMGRRKRWRTHISIHAPREGCDLSGPAPRPPRSDFNPRTPRGVRRPGKLRWAAAVTFQSTHPARGATRGHPHHRPVPDHFNPRTPRGVRQQTLPKSREFAWLNLLICTRGRRLSIRKQTRLCSMKLSFMLFGCEPAGEGVSSWTSHATKSKVRLEGRSAYSQSVRSSAHSDFPGNKSGGCPVRDP